MVLTSFTHSSLFAFITPPFKESVVAHVFDHRSALPGDVQRTLDNAINRTVKIPQFPNHPAKAPVSFLRQPIIDLLPDSESLANVVLQAWFAAQEELYARVKSHLNTREIDADYPDFVGHQLPGSWAYDDWMSERDRILASHGDLTDDDVALMLCLATGKMPTGTEDISEDKALLNGRGILEEVRSYLEQLPADSPEWSSEVPDFSTFITEIMSLKRAEREGTALRAELDAKISDLRGRHSSDLTYLELDATTWRVFPGLQPSEASAALGFLSDLDTLLEGYDRSLPVGSSVSQSLLLREEHDNLVQSIRNLKGAIDQILLLDDRRSNELLEPTSNSIAQTEGPEEGSRIALSGIELSYGSLAFDPEITNYFIELDSDVEQLLISPTATRERARINITIEPSNDAGIHALESESGTFAVTGLNVGQMTLFITVSLDSSEVGRTYTLTITRRPSVDATLREIRLSEGSIDFKPFVDEYRLQLSNLADGFSIKPIPSHRLSQIQVWVNDEGGAPIKLVAPKSGEYLIKPLPIGETVISLLVTAEDPTVTRTYTVIIAKAAIGEKPSTVDQDHTREVIHSAAEVIEGEVTVAAEEEATQCEPRNTLPSTGHDLDLETKLWSLVDCHCCIDG